jgi:tetratricopeptide (TPR) repeat protein
MVPVFSAGGDGNSEKSSGSNLGVKKLDNYTFAVKKINKAKKLEKKGKTVKAAKYYQKALDYLLKANAEKPANPDTLNYLGFSNRKLGNYDDAEIYYLLGLEINPTHIGINEYLGELYVETNRIVKAEERLNVIKNCNCEEYDELKEIIEGAKRSIN